MNGLNIRQDYLNMAEDHKNNLNEKPEVKMSDVENSNKRKRSTPSSPKNDGELHSMDIFRLYNEIQHVWYILLVDIRDENDYNISHIRRSMNIPYNTSMSAAEITNLIVAKKFHWASKILFYCNYSNNEEEKKYTKHMKKLIDLIEDGIATEKLAFEKTHPTYHFLDCTYDFFFGKYAFLCYKNPLHFNKSSKNENENDNENKNESENDESKNNDNDNNNNNNVQQAAPGSAGKEEDTETAIFGDSYPNVVINDFLFLGDKYHAKDPKVMKYLGITHVLNCTTSTPNYFDISRLNENDTDDNNNNNNNNNGGEDGITSLGRAVHYHRLDIEDRDNIQVGWYLDDAMQFIDKALKYVWHVDSEGNPVERKDESKDNDSGTGSDNDNNALRQRGKVLIHCAAGISRSSTVLIAYLMKMKQWRYDDTLEFVKCRRDCVEPNEAFVRQLRLLDEMWFGDTKSVKYSNDGLDIEDLTNAKPLYDMASGISRIVRHDNLNEDDEDEEDEEERRALWMCDTCRLYNCIQESKSNIIIDIRSSQVSVEDGSIYDLSHIARAVHIPMTDDTLSMFNKLKVGMTQARVYKIIIYCDFDDILHCSHNTTNFQIKHNELDSIESMFTAAFKRRKHRKHSENANNNNNKKTSMSVSVGNNNSNNNNSNGENTNNNNSNNNNNNNNININEDDNEDGVQSVEDSDNNFDNDNPTKLKYDANIEARIKHILRIIDLIDARTLMNKPSFYVYEKSFDSFFMKYPFLCYINKNLALKLHNEMRAAEARTPSHNTLTNMAIRYRPGSSYNAYNKDLSPIVEIQQNEKGSPKPRLVVSHVSNQLEDLKSMQDSGNELSRKSQERKEMAALGLGGLGGGLVRPTTGKNSGSPRKMDFMVSPGPSGQLNAGHHPDFQANRPLSPFSPLDASTPHSSITPMHGTPRPDTPLDDHPITPTLSGEAMEMGSPKSGDGAEGGHKNLIQIVQDQGNVQAPILNIPLKVSESVSRSNSARDHHIANAAIVVNIVDDDGADTDVEVPGVPSASPLPSSNPSSASGNGGNLRESRANTAKSVSKSRSISSGENNDDSRGGEDARTSINSRSQTPLSPTYSANSSHMKRKNIVNFNSNTTSIDGDDNNNSNIQIIKERNYHNHSNNNVIEEENDNGTEDEESESGNTSLGMTPPDTSPNSLGIGNSAHNHGVGVGVGSGHGVAIVFGGSGAQPHNNRPIAVGNNTSNQSNFSGASMGSDNSENIMNKRSSGKSNQNVTFAEDIDEVGHKRRDSVTISDSISATETAATESVTYYSTLSRPHTATATQTAFTTDVETSVRSIIDEWGAAADGGGPFGGGNGPKLGISLALQKGGDDAPVEKFETVTYDTMNKQDSKDNDLNGALYDTSLVYPSQIVFDAIFLGDGEQATNENIVKNLKITHILNVSNKVDNVFESHKELNYIKYCRIKIFDGELVPIEKYFDKAITFIDNALKSNTKNNNNNNEEYKDSGNNSNDDSSNGDNNNNSSNSNNKNEKNRVLIHCQQGVSRSTTLLIAYLMKCRQMAYTMALTYVQDKRSTAEPNRGFKGKLKEFDRQLFT